MSLENKDIKQEKLVLLPEYDSNNPNYHDNIICDFILKETLGKGTFGVVKLAINNQTREKVAIKIINETKLPKEEKLNFLREIEILKELKHPNIIRIFSHINKEKQIYIITEYIKGIELFQYISLKKKIPESEACIYFQQIISGLEYLHKMGIAHRDIKAENILVDHYSKEIKIIDFGLSNRYTKNSNLLSTLCGSPLYAAPEVLQGRGYKACPVDIWSCGVVLYFMLSGNLPFQADSDKDLYKKIIEAKIKNINGVSKEANDLIKNILNPNPRKRIKISEIKEHPWFNLFNNNNFANLNYYGLLSNKYVIPIDEDIVLEIKNRYKISEDEIRASILGNNLNDISTIYYLIVLQKNKEGKKSISDFKSDIFINYIKDSSNLFKKYSNDINKVIRFRKKGIEFEKKMRLERSNSKSIKGISLERINTDDKKDFFRSLSPTIKNFKYELVNSYSSNNTRLQSPKSIKSLENSDLLNSNSNFKYKAIDAEVESFKHKRRGKYKKLFVKTNANKLNNYSERRKISKYSSNNNYNKSELENKKIKNYNTNNNLSSEKKNLEKEKFKKFGIKSENKNNIKCLTTNNSRSKNKNNTNKNSNYYIKNINNEKEKNIISLTEENNIPTLPPIKESLNKFKRENNEKNMTKERELFYCKKPKKGLLYKKNEIKKIKNEIIVKEPISNKREMNSYFSEDLLDIKNINKYKKSYELKVAKSNLLKIKNLKINTENDKYADILSYFKTEKNRIKKDNDNILSDFDVCDNNNNGFFEPFDLNSIYLKKKGQIKKEFIGKIEKKKIKYKTMGNYSFIIEMKNNISFKSTIILNKNIENGDLCILKIKKIKGNNSTIFNCLKKIMY